MSTFQFALVNDATVDENCDNLQPGQVVCLGVNGQDCSKIYTVVEDDTCDWIQQQYGIANETLYANNPQINADCTNIYIGEVLCVDTKAFTYPAYNATLFEVSAGTGTRAGTVVAEAEGGGDVSEGPNT